MDLLSLLDVFEPLSNQEIEQLNGQLSDIHLEAGEIFYGPQDWSYPRKSAIMNHKQLGVTP